MPRSLENDLSTLSSLLNSGGTSQLNSGGTSQSLQSAPLWFQQYMEKLHQRAAQEGARSYEAFKKLNAQQSKVLEEQVKKLQQVQKGDKHAFIPFSVTGSSEPINLSPQELLKISNDTGFAESVYKAATGLPYITQGEIGDLQARANDYYTRRKEFPPLKEFPGSHTPWLTKQEELELIGKVLPSIHKIGKPWEKYITPEGWMKDFTPQTWGSLSTNPKYPANDLSNLMELANTARTYNLEQVRAVHNIRDIAKKYLDEKKAEKEDPQESPLDIQNLLERAGAEREIKNLMQREGRIAPMNELHEQAQRLLSESFDADTLDLAKDEIQDAKRHSAKKAVEPLIKASMEGPDEYMQKYANKYQQNVIKALKDEAKESLFEEIIPKINTSFAQHGAYHSGARMEAIRKATQAKERSLHREIAHLLSHQHDKGMEHYQAEKNRTLHAADVMRQATTAEHEAAKSRSALLQGNALAQHGLTHSNAAALSHMARAQQEQLQNEINMRHQEFEKEKNHNWEQLAKQAALAQGLPVPATQHISSQGQVVPVPPNPYNFGAGTLAMLAASQGQGGLNNRLYAQGGHVKKYAGGGEVESEPDATSRLRNLIEEQEAANLQRMQTSQINPFSNWASHVGHAMLSNPAEDPLVNVGHGTFNALQHLEASRERMANLYDKINASRLNQYKVLAAFENQKAARAHQEKALESMNRRHAMSLAAQDRRHAESLARSEGHHQERMEALKGMRGKESATQRKLINDAQKDLLRAIRMKKEVNHLGELASKLSTGPRIGKFNKGILEGKEANKLRIGANKLILDMHQGMKNIPRSEEFLKRIESTKPSIENYPEANQEAIDLMMQGASDIEQHSISTLLDAGWSPQQIEKKFKIKVPSHLLEEGEESLPEEELPEEEALPEENEEEMIDMIGPEGDYGSIPRQNVKAALEEGYRYAE